MLEFLKKKAVKPAELDPETKLLIEENLEDGLKSSEIAERLALDVQVVYRYTESVKLRKARRANLQGSSGENTEIKKLKEELLIQDLKHQAATKKERQDLELEKLKLEIEQKKAELYGDDEEDEPDAVKGGLELIKEGELPSLLSFLMMLFNKSQGGNTPNARPQATTPGQTTAGQTTPGVNQSSLKEFSEEITSPPKVVVSEDGQAVEMPLQSPPDMTEDQIKKIAGTIPKTFIKIAKKWDRDTFKSFIRQKYPLSENSLNLAWEMINDGRI